MRRLLVVLVLVGAGLSVWEGDQYRASSAAHLSVLVVIVVVFLSALVAGRGRQAQRVGAWVGGPLHLRRQLQRAPRRVGAVALWVLIVGGAIGWDLFSFSEQRHDLPTFSRIVGVLSAHWAGRSAVFALWLVLGVTLAVGWRRTT